MSDGNRRKRKRWDSNETTVNKDSNNDVADQDALKALIESAESRQRERQQPTKYQRHHQHHRHDNNRQRDNSRQSSSSRSQENQSGYYGPSDSRSNRENSFGNTNNTAPADEPQEKEKPNFGLSGALTKDEQRGNVYKGVVLKFSEPPDARTPSKTHWRFYVFKGDEHIETLHISRQSAYLMGRNETIADIPLRHASCSSQHAVLQYRALAHAETGKLQCQPYIMDLESTHGTFLNQVKLDVARYYQLKVGDVLKFGASTREYVLMTATTKAV